MSPEFVPDIAELDVGYHYTSIENWQSIQEIGLIPNKVTTSMPDLAKYFSNIPNGVWLWDEEPEGKSELGAIIYQLVTKCFTQVVKLAVFYKEKDALHFNDPELGPRRIKLSHNSSIANWNFNMYNQNAVLITEPVPRNNIRLVRSFDLMDIVKDK